MQVWQQLYDSRRRRAYQKALNEYLRRLAQRAQFGSTLGQAQGGQRMDLLQFGSGGGGNSSLFGGSPFQGEFGSTGPSWVDALLGLGGMAISAFANREDPVGQYGDPWGPNILRSQEAHRQAALAASMQGGCGSPWVSGGAALSPSMFSMTNPASGKLTWFRPAGRPILWSSDLGACRRVARIARKAKRRSGGR
jgi:hypothetical protein